MWPCSATHWTYIKLLSSHSFKNLYFADRCVRKKFGGLKFDVEEGKKENRSKELFNMPLSDFLNSYKSKDIYMVASLPKAMSGMFYECL